MRKPERAGRHPLRSAVVWGLACLGLTLPATAGAQTPPNVLVVLVDDLGIEHVELFGVGSQFLPTPTLDALAAGGLVFENAWSEPICSPTRAVLLTGRYPFRTGVGEAVQSDADKGLALSELTLPEVLRFHAPTPYATAAFGKWHLGMDPSLGGLAAPNEAGFEHFEGTRGNLTPDGETYFDYTKITDGVGEPASGYLTSDTIDWAASWIATAPEPWFAYVALHAPHSPTHLPPEDLHTQDPGDGSVLNLYRAMAEAADTEIGRLLDSVNLASTVVVFLSDNGSASSVTLPPFSSKRSKRTVFEGGVRIPMVIGGASVSLGRVADPVNVADVFATVVELAGATLPEGNYDGVSLVPYFSEPQAGPLRAFNFTETFSPNGPGPWSSRFEAARDARYKLVTNGSREGFFDLVADPYETTELLSSGTLSPGEQASYDALRAYFAELDAGACELLQAGEACVDDAECCSNKCRGGPGRKTCR